MKKLTILIVCLCFTYLLSSAQQQSKTIETTMEYEAISEQSSNKGTGYCFIFDIGENNIPVYYSFILLNKSKIINAKEIKCSVIDIHNQRHEIIIPNDFDHVIPHPNGKIDLVAIPMRIILMKLNGKIKINPVYDIDEQHLEIAFKGLTPEEIAIFKRRIKEFVKK
jgi:hypothetical protein